MKKISLQTYSIRRSFKENDIADVLNKIKNAGYDQIQLAGYTPSDLAAFKALCDEIGLEIMGTVWGFDEMEADPALTMAQHSAMGTCNIGIGGYFYKTADDVYKFIERANKFAAEVAKYGFKFAYHNHSHEFIRYENGKSAFEMLIEGLDKNISFMLDTYWIQHGGANPVDMINALSGRIEILHLKDMKRNQDGPFFAAVGEGNLNWNAIIDAAEKAGVKYYVVEQDESDIDPFDSVRMSAEYLHKNFIK